MRLGQFPVVLLAVCSVLVPACSGHENKATECRIDEPPEVGLILGGVPPIFRTAALVVGMVDEDVKTRRMALYQHRGEGERVALLEYAEPDADEFFSDAIPVPLDTSNGSRKAWDVEVMAGGVMGTGISRLVVADPAWDLTVILMSRSETVDLTSLASSIERSEGEWHIADYDLTAEHRVSHVPGIGSIPLSQAAQIRGLSYTNDHLQQHLQQGFELPQIAIALGITRACADVNPLEVFSWWFEPFQRPSEEVLPRSVTAHFPSLAGFDDEILDIWLTEDGHLATMTGFGLKPAEFDRLRERVLVVTADEQHEHYERFKGQ